MVLHSTNPGVTISGTFTSTIPMSSWRTSGIVFSFSVPQFPCPETRTFHRTHNSGEMDQFSAPVFPLTRAIECLTRCLEHTWCSAKISCGHSYYCYTHAHTHMHADTHTRKMSWCPLLFPAHPLRCDTHGVRVQHGEEVGADEELHGGGL